MVREVFPRVSITGERAAQRDPRGVIPVTAQVQVGAANGAGLRIDLLPVKGDARLGVLFKYGLQTADEQASSAAAGIVDLAARHRANLPSSCGSKSRAIRRTMSRGV